LGLVVLLSLSGPSFGLEKPPPNDVQELSERTMALVQGTGGMDCTLALVGVGLGFALLGPGFLPALALSVSLHGAAFACI